MMLTQFLRDRRRSATHPPVQGAPCSARPRLINWKAAALFAVMTAGATPLHAQGAGTTVSGRVTDAATGLPIQQARVLIGGTQVGSLTGEMADTRSGPPRRER